MHMEIIMVLKARWHIYRCPLAKSTKQPMFVLTGFVVSYKQNFKGHSPYCPWPRNISRPSYSLVLMNWKASSSSSYSVTRVLLQFQFHG